MHLDRIRLLAGLQEARQITDPDDEDDARRLRERNITKLIMHAFQRIGLTIAEDGVFYQEDVDREALVTLDDDQVDVTVLAQLVNSGLAADYKIWGTRNELTVMFHVKPDLDHAQIPTRP